MSKTKKVILLILSPLLNFLITPSTTFLSTLIGVYVKPSICAGTVCDTKFMFLAASSLVTAFITILFAMSSFKYLNRQKKIILSLMIVCYHVAVDIGFLLLVT